VTIQCRIFPEYPPQLCSHINSLVYPSPFSLQRSIYLRDQCTLELTQPQIQETTSLFFLLSTVFYPHKLPCVPLSFFSQEIYVPWKPMYHGVNSIKNTGKYFNQSFIFYIFLGYPSQFFLKRSIYLGDQCSMEFISHKYRKLLHSFFIFHTLLPT